MPNDRNDAAVAIGCLATLAGVAVLLAAGAVLEGFVLRLLWGWHLTPTIHIAAPSIATCIGLAALASALQNPPINKGTDDDPSGKRAMAYLFVRPLFLLLIGWIAYLFAR